MWSEQRHIKKEENYFILKAHLRTFLVLSVNCCCCCRCPRGVDMGEGISHSQAGNLVQLWRRAPLSLSHKGPPTQSPRCHLPLPAPRKLTSALRNLCTVSRRPARQAAWPQPSQASANVSVQHCQGQARASGRPRAAEAVGGRQPAGRGGEESTGRPTRDLTPPLPLGLPHCTPSLPFRPRW